MLSFALSLLHCLSYPQAETPVAHIARLPSGVERPRIDADLDDPAWQHAVVITDLKQVLPLAGAEPSEATEVRILFDERSLFIALLCLDREPDLIRASQRQRDANLDPDDRVELLLDPFLDRRNAFWFQIGPGGSKGDALITRNGATFNKPWDTIWFGEARVTERGWEAELEIPVSSINFDPAARAWGFNVRRFIRRKSEEVQWASPTPRLRFFSVANAGTLEGFADLHQGLGLDVKPYALARFVHDPAGDDDTFLDGGLDVFYRFTPSTKLLLSLNTDFAETEVDDRQVNLTRFPLFFPEKRDFFLEDSGVFAFGSASSGTGPPGGSGGGGPSAGGQDLVPFFSRRIGLDASGKPVPLLAALKATSTTDRYSVGVLDVQADRTGELDSQNLFAARAAVNVLEQSDVGALVTAGDPDGGDGNSTIGIDGNFRTDEFLGDRNLQWNLYALRSDRDGGANDDYAWQAGFNFPNDEVAWDSSVTSIGSEFDPALGFVRRAGIRKYHTNFMLRPRLYNRIRQLEFGLHADLVTDLADETETVLGQWRLLRILLESGDSVRFDLVHNREVLEEGFEIQEDVEIPPGGYTFTRYEIALESSDKRAVSAKAEWKGGEFFGGERQDLSLGLEWRGSALLLFGADYQRNDVDLPEGNFIVHVARARTNLQFSPELTWANFVQWDNQSELIGLNSRLWWIPTPFQEVFFVVNQGWDYDTERFAPEGGDVTVKFGTTFRY